MTKDLAILATILIAVLIGIDILFLSYRKRQFEMGKPLSQIPDRIRDWIKAHLPHPTPQSERPANLSPIMENTNQLPNPASPSGPNIETSLETQSVTGADGKVRVSIIADIPEGTVVYITLQAVNGEGKATIQHGTAAPQMQPVAMHRQRQPIGAWFKTTWKDRLLPWLTSLATGLDKQLPGWQLGLFIFAGLIYFLAISIGLNRFPIYFFTDEAVHTNLAADFVQNGWKNYQGEFLPTYFSLGPMFALNGISVYLQVIPYLLFGKSVIVTRLVSGIITLIGVMAIGLLLRDTFKFRAYWLGILLPITSPAWFLHARTAFEYMEVAAFYALFLYFYNRYRAGHVKSLFGAVIAGVLVFYTHGLGQMLIGVTGLLLFLVDIRYHFGKENRKTLLWAAALLIILALPYVRYQLAHPAAIEDQIRQRGSFFMDAGLTTPEKLQRFVKEYFNGINPMMWYTGNNGDLVRHVMKGYGYLWLTTAPFLLIGLLESLWRIREAPYRITLIALLVSPIPAALVATSITRMLWMIIPISIIIAIGLHRAGSFVTERANVKQSTLELVTLAIIGGFVLFMTRDALINGPLWFQDYTLYGMQYGGQQIFEETILPRLKEDPNVRFIVSPSWANGTDQLLFFFIPKEVRGRVGFGTLEEYLYKRREITDNSIFVATTNEYNNSKDDPKLIGLTVLEELAYPNGQAGFYFVKTGYSAQADALFEQEAEERRKPVTEMVDVDGETLTVTFSRMGAGALNEAFDGNFYSLVRGLEANPLMFDIQFPGARPLAGLDLTTGTMEDFTVTVRLYLDATAEPVEYVQEFKNTGSDPTVKIDFDKGPAQVLRAVILIKNNTSGATAQIHVRDIIFR